MGRMYYPDCTERKVQCPICDWVFPSERYDPQCSKCHHRFNGYEHPFKTPEDRKNERKKHEKELAQVHSQLESLIFIVKKIRKDLRPLD